MIQPIESWMMQNYNRVKTLGTRQVTSKVPDSLQHANQNHRYVVSISNLHMLSPLHDQDDACDVDVMYKQHSNSNRRILSRRDALISSLLSIPIGASAASASINIKNDPLENILLGIVF